MKGTSFASEEFFLRIFKIIILIVMGVSLIISMGGLIYSAIQYSQSPKDPAPAKTAPRETVDMKEFIEQLKPKKAQEQPREETEEKKEESKPEKETPPKYLNEAKKVVDCINQSNKPIGRELTAGQIENLTEAIRQFYESRALAPRRGDEWVQDSAKFLCDVYSNEAVAALRKSNPDLGIINSATGYHTRQWDDIQQRIAEFNQEEQQRIRSERMAEMERVLAAKAKALDSLIMVGIAFGIFMALALYLIFASIESNLRNINQSIKDFTKSTESIAKDAHQEPVET